MFTLLFFKTFVLDYESDIIDPYHVFSIILAEFVSWVIM